MSEWKIRRFDPNTGEAIEQTFEAAGVATAVRRLANQAPDSCALVFARLHDLPDWTQRESVEILRDDDTWFSGTVNAPARPCSGSNERLQVTIRGPWSELERTPFRQVGMFILPPGEEGFVTLPDLEASIPAIPGFVIDHDGDGSFIGYSPEIISHGRKDADPRTVPWNGKDGTQTPPPALAGYRVQVVILPSKQLRFVYSVIDSTFLQIGALEDGTLVQVQTRPALSSIVFLGGDGTSVVNGRDVILAALNFAIARGANFQIGDVDDLPNYPRQEIRDPSCADVVRNALRLFPDVSTWFDYSTTPPTFYAQSRANREALAAACGDDGSVESIAVVPRPEDVLAGVELEYTRRHDYTDSTGAAQTIYSLEIDQAGPSPNGPGALVANIELQGSLLGDNGKPSSNFEPTPEGLAQRIYDARKDLSYSGQVLLVNEDCPAAFWVGRVLNVTGGETEWAEMRAEIQESEDDTASGRTTLTLGPPAQLGPADWRAILRAIRGRRKDPVLDATTSGGSAAVPPALPASPPRSPSVHGGDPPDAEGDEVTHTAAGFLRNVRKFTMSDYPAGPLPWNANSAPDSAWLAEAAAGSHAEFSPADWPTAHEANPFPAPAAGDRGPYDGGVSDTSTGLHDEWSSSDSNGQLIAPSGIQVGHQRNRSRAGFYTTAELDLTGYNLTNTKRVLLEGTYSISQADGSTYTHPISYDLTPYLGAARSRLQIFAPDPAQYSHSSSVGTQAQKWASQTLNSIRILPRTL